MPVPAINIEALVARYEKIRAERMQGLPIVNPVLQVEAVGFREHEGQHLGVLITPWFMNLLLLPTGDDWEEEAQGNTVDWEFPGGPVEFTVSVDEELGTFLSAILFRSMTDMPDQETARAIAEEIMKNLFVKVRDDKGISRRALLSGLGNS
jgi:[NiFe] hydrogenase assembly HybE family chaperone